MPSKKKPRAKASSARRAAGLAWVARGGGDEADGSREAVIGVDWALGQPGNLYRARNALSVPIRPPLPVQLRRKRTKHCMDTAQLQPVTILTRILPIRRIEAPLDLPF